MARIRETAERTREAVESVRGRAASGDGSIEAAVSAPEI
ncbi:hypothetical protein Pd630_LPD04740 [Rhodococcus opacus PD630]|nr:hypothetical protein Pd630_LPD04740 [Rhodococcus opacus PD630]